MLQYDVICVVLQRGMLVFVVLCFMVIQCAVHCFVLLLCDVLFLVLQFAVLVIVMLQYAVLLLLLCCTCSDWCIAASCLTPWRRPWLWAGREVRRRAGRTGASRGRRGAERAGRGRRATGGIFSQTRDK